MFGEPGKIRKMKLQRRKEKSKKNNYNEEDIPTIWKRRAEKVQLEVEVEMLEKNRKQTDGMMEKDQTRVSYVRTERMSNIQVGE